jgi:hypothetical protein
MEPDCKKRLTVAECLQHNWMGQVADFKMTLDSNFTGKWGRSYCSQGFDQELSSPKEDERYSKINHYFLYYINFLAAVLGVMATNKMRRGFQLASISAENNNNNNNSNSTTATSTQVKTEVVKPVLPDTKYEMLLKVCAGRNLVAKDSNGKSDPYISIWCGKYKYKTKVIKKVDCLLPFVSFSY